MPSLHPTQSFQQLASTLRYVTSPAERYRHARVLHGIRVSLAMLTSILLTSGIDIPHGIWASVSMLVVIGGLQHQGNIRQKAFERAVGTAIGAVFGLLWVAQYAVLGSTLLTYLLLSVTAGICGYHAIGKGGYIALLTAITMCIVAGHGDDSIQIGLWRTANVLIGIVIALVFSFALPLHATYSWRHGLALNLRVCAGILKRLFDGPGMSAAEQIDAFGRLGKRLVSLRGLMVSVAKEGKTPLAELERIQWEHRAFISALEMMASAPLTDRAGEHAALASAMHRSGTEIRRTLLRTARRLRSTTPGRSGAAWVQAAHADEEAGLDDGPAQALSGPHWLVQQMVSQADRLEQMLDQLATSGSLLI